MLVRLVNKWKIDPVDLKYLYGTGGNKYLFGGILIRECTSMYSYNTKIEDTDIIGNLVRHKARMIKMFREK